MSDPVYPNQNLFPREAQCLKLMLEGMANKEIAGIMGLTEGTVKVYTSRIFTKKSVTSRTELIVREYAKELAAARCEIRELQRRLAALEPDNAGL
jgi:DNA-binding NarL/FixJ family response regulator